MALGTAIAAITGLGGLALSAKGQSDAKKAASQAANAPTPTVNIPQLQQQAQDIATQNAARSAELEAQYNPGAAELRSGSLEALLSSLDPEQSSALRDLIAGGPPNLAAPGARPDLSTNPERAALSPVAARDPLTGLPTRGPASAINADLLAKVAAQAGQPLTNAGFDSGLTRDAIAQAQADLALGGQLPQDVRNLIARTAAARAGAITGGRNLQMGRDITARDLGLTSLDLRNQRLDRASAIGAQEAALEQANAAMRAQAEQFGRTNLLQSQGAAAADEAFREQQFATDAQMQAQRDALVSSNYATDAQIQAQRDALLSGQYSTDAQIRAQQDALRSQNYATDAQLQAARDALASQNYFSQAGLMDQIASGDFAKVFQAAQLGQNIAQPASGLDPGSVANLAVGNQNLTAAQQQNAAAIAAQAARDKTALGSQVMGAGLGFLSKLPATTPVYQPLQPAATTAFKPYIPSYSQLGK